MEANERYYTPYAYAEVKESFFPADAPDYNERINLIAGKGQAIIAYGALTEQDKTVQFNTPDAENRLTDGILAKEATYSDPAWFRFTRGVARSIIFDIGAVAAVSELSIRFLKENATAVRLPNNVSFSVSVNGVDFAQAAIADGIRCDGEGGVATVDKVLEKPVRARFVRVTFCCPVHIYIDQIYVFGTKNAEGACLLVPDSRDADTYPDRYCSAEQLGGAKDVALAYFCHENQTPLEVEHLLPYVGYIKDGKITDTLFDGYLFLPFVAFLYEGYKKKPLDKSKWQYYMDTQFLEGKNLDALDEAARQVKEALGLPELKLKVFFSILYPVPEQHEFGVVDGKMRDFAVLEDRIAAMKWLIDEQEERFYAKKYEHLQLSGFYWFTEEIDYEDSQLLEMIRVTTDYVRSKNLITTWIPYYLASGYNDWRRLGFDMACYQPNYAFSQGIPEQRLYDAADTAKLLGMCIELEIGGLEKWNVEHTRNYYAVGAQTRYMQDAAHMYYLGSLKDVMFKSCYSDDPYFHTMYDDTYRFIKGTYPPDALGESTVIKD